MKGMAWLIKLIMSALITSMVCIASTFWVINTYVDMVLEQYQLKTTVQSTPSWSQLVGRLTQQLSMPKADSRSVALGEKTPKDQAVTGAISPDGSITVPSGAGGGSGSSSAGAGSTGSESPATTPTGKEGTPADKNPPEDAIAVFGHQSGQSGSSTGSGSSSASDADKRVVVSGEDFTKKKDQLTNEEKNKIFNLLMTRVPQDEMQRISRLMEDGITAAELKEIEQVLQKYLKPEEYTQLLSMIKPS
ncbi:hypothetical protein [Paenibacillus rigui]|uniref:Spore coat protein n=1 Tax=Paenibacillus rigui TaxID=554312 RepID=A0A229UM51_9BACL|nr:hypothetical protein [Paenibacillus rigui]OXM84547.1 hypothetical protein CF651_20115 [Paenibacillus rigui]